MNCDGRRQNVFPSPSSSQTDMMPIEYAALMREMCVAFRLLEDFGGLKPGDSVILNAVRFSSLSQVHPPTTVALADQWRLDLPSRSSHGASS